VEINGTEPYPRIFSSESILELANQIRIPTTRVSDPDSSGFGFNQVSASESVFGIRIPDLYLESGSRSRRAKIKHKSKKN
jgi:hypothetical protein